MLLKKSHLFIVIIYSLNECYMEHPKYEHDDILNGYYAYHIVPAVWREAMLRCKYEGGTIMSPVTSDHVSRMMQFVTSLQENTPGASAFTGFNAFLSRGDYHTVEGTPIHTLELEWDIPENDPRTKPGCAVLQHDEVLMGVSCDETHPYVCYRQFEEPSLCPFPGYVVKNPDGHCYKFHQEFRTWSRSFMTCAAEGGYLLILNSQAEAKEMAALYKAEIPSNARTTCAHIGFHDLIEHGTHRNINGMTLGGAGYQGWGKNQPDNGSNYGPEYCGSMFTSGLLNDMNCEYRTNFFCEVDMN